MLNDWGPEAVDLYPEDLRAEIDAIDDRVYADVNNGVYRAGFADAGGLRRGVRPRCSTRWTGSRTLLGERRYLAGDRITEADWRLFPTLVRFDAVYHVALQCNGRRVIDYPNLWGYARELYQQPGIAETVDVDEIKRHYYTTHDELNPKRIIPRAARPRLGRRTGAAERRARTDDPAGQCFLPFGFFACVRTVTETFVPCGEVVPALGLLLMMRPALPLPARLETVPERAVGGVRRRRVRARLTVRPLSVGTTHRSGRRGRRRRGRGRRRGLQRQHERRVAEGVVTGAVSGCVRPNGDRVDADGGPRSRADDLGRERHAGRRVGLDGRGRAGDQPSASAGSADELCDGVDAGEVDGRAGARLLSVSSSH